MSRYLFQIVLFFSVLFVNAQERTITGFVYGKSEKDPLIGATIVVKGTFTGVSADMDGKFILKADSKFLEGKSLEISYLGYLPQTFNITDKANHTFFLKEDVNSLNEVVVTSSYGTKKLKQEVVGSITNVKTQDLIVEQPAVSFDQLLQGQAAGVYIESNPNPGKPIDIHIRGQGSLSPVGGTNVGTSTQPLIIVDGIIMSEELTIDGSAFFDGGDGRFSENLLNPLSKVGITDIESINILKDAAAVSLYGADGANGVIIITTKGGGRGSLQVEASTQAGINTRMNDVEYMSGEQYQDLRNLYYQNSGQPGNVVDWNGVDTDWYDLLNRVGSFQRYNLSLSGGSDRFGVRASFGFSDTQEPQVNNNFKKYNGSLALSYQTDKLNATLKTSPSLTVKNSPNTLSNYAVPPTIAPYDEEGNFTTFDTYGNPLAVAYQNKALVETKGLLNSLSVSYDLLENLKVSSLFGLDYSDKHQDTYFSGLNQTGIDNKGNIGERLIRTKEIAQWNWNARLFYKKYIKTVHYIDLLAGVETRGNSNYSTYNKGENFPEAGTIMPISMAESTTYHDDSSESTGRSFFSQLNYDFKKKYFLLGNFRIDQSSAFGNDNQTSYNGGLGLSWVVSKENFMKDIPWIQSLRIRTSYGTSGNSRIGSYAALGLYSVYDESYGGYNRGYYATPSTAPNPYLGWEKNYKFNAGIDLVTSARISTTIEFFHDDIRDMIVSRNVIPETGYGNIQINGANMYNRGLEVSLRYNVFANPNFKWTSSLNFAFIENKVTYLLGLGSKYSSSTRATAQKIGYATSLIWGYNYIGIDPATGRELYQVGDDIVDGDYLSSKLDDSEYWEPIGDSQPDVFGGFINQFRIGSRFSAGINMSYALGAEAYIQKEFVDHYRVITNRNLAVNAYEQSWKHAGDIAWYPAVSKSNPLISNSTKYLYSTSHIKLNSVNLSYSVPMSKNKLRVSNLSVFVNGANLYYWYFERSPEGLNGVAELKNMYPDMRTFSLGIKARFE